MLPRIRATRLVVALVVSCALIAAALHPLRSRARGPAHAAQRNLAAARGRIGFSGRIGRRALRPRRYRVTLTATDTAGNRSRPRRASFRVVR
jgi:hypothetical protein